ncbi:TolB-like translocation protein [Bythopirellula goksoeyrii]|uniref:PEP-CTERM protein-sorting domain-containing protein n=1 Tax=Bythopirellula goksoeyrii TaxID=1400387 RepID=A0A5B9Q4R0_9BACT|nr:hypothetical protein [Bythopirellula goksoeyrii]QEG34024.1 hypothetical protein Pr1d_12960 [Bythopirellula goksoeyrii]
MSLLEYTKYLFAGLLSAVCWFAFGSVAQALDNTSPLQLSLENGWQAFELVSQGDDISAISDVGFGSIASSGKYDGLGVFLSGSMLSIHVNHEAVVGAISRVDVQLDALQEALASKIAGGATPFPSTLVTGIGFSYSRIFDKNYHATDAPDPVAMGTAAVSTYGDSNFSRFCSGTAYLPHAFGQDRGFVDPIYITGEETFDEFGQMFALDQLTRTLWEIPDLGTSSWENSALVDTGNSTHIAMVLNADKSDEPLRLYVGEKGVDANLDGSIDLLERNGLRGGTVYYFLPDEGMGTTLPDGQINGAWSTTTTGALTEDKIEDVHTNPADGSQLVFADQNDGVYRMDLNLQFLAGIFNPSTSTTSIYQIDDAGSEAAGIGRPDNVTWSLDGNIYVQEDGDGDDMWQIDPNGSGLKKIAHAFSEPSGIIDVSAQVGYQPGSIFLTSVQGLSNGSSGAQLCVLISPTVSKLIDSADFDLDDDIDGSDLLQWQRNVGATAMGAFATTDANHDGVVDSLDLGVWQAQYDTFESLLAAQIPEPSTLGLLLCMAGVSLPFRKLGN